MPTSSAGSLLWRKSSRAEACGRRTRYFSECSIRRTLLPRSWPPSGSARYLCCRIHSLAEASSSTSSHSANQQRSWCPKISRGIRPPPGFCLTLPASSWNWWAGATRSSGSIAELIAVPAPFDSQRDAPAFIVFTSGTTGKPKGVIHAHQWLDALGDSNRARVPPRPDDVVLATGEWSFISALGHNVLFPLRNGVAGSIMDGRASPERILETIARDRVTLLYSVATLYRRILAVPRIEQGYDLRSLRGANSTGEPLEDSRA